MEHVVVVPQAEAGPTFTRVPSLEAAVELVERLRNVDGVEDAEVMALTPVPLTIRTVYKVELPTGAGTSTPAAAHVEAAPAPDLTVGEAPAATATAAVTDDQPPTASIPTQASDPVSADAASEPEPDAVAKPAGGSAFTRRTGKNASLGYFAR